MSGSLPNLHRGLKEYYALHNIEYQNIKQTKWDTYVDDNGLEDEDIEQELEDLTLDPTDALVIDFDPNFPLDDDVDITDDDARAAGILKILRYCFKKGSAPSPYKTANIIDIDDNKVTTSVVTNAKNKLQLQAPAIYSQSTAEKDLMYFLAVRDVNNDYPYLENMVQSYSRDRLNHYIATKQVLPIADYICNAKGSSYISMLKKKYNYQPAKDNKPNADVTHNIVHRLQCAMSSYVNRVCPSLGFSSLKRIDDNIIDISNYILSASELVKQIIDGEKCTPPFQIDLLIVVKNIITLPDPLDDGDDDDDDDDDDIDDINDDNDIKTVAVDLPYFSQIENRLNSSKLAFVLKMMSKKFDNYNVDDDNKDNDNKDNDKDIDDAFTSSRSRKMLGHYKEFRDKLDKNHKKNKKNKKKLPKNHKPFDPATYPERKRFCILVDRKTDNTKDRVIFYEPPYVCDTMPKGKHINEWYFESARTCLLPSDTFYDDYAKKSASPNDQQTDDNKANATIQSNVAAQNKLLTFSFQIEQKDQIKCYMYWGGHAHRFYPVDVIKVFQFMFTDDQYNALSTPSNKKLMNDIMGAMYIKDAQFEQFYKSLDKSNQNIKFNKL